MPYQLSWYIPDKVLRLSLSKGIGLVEFKDLNHALLESLTGKSNLILMIDLRGIEPLLLPWDYLRATQTYVNHPNLDTVMVIGHSKSRLVRLMMMVLFNLSKATLLFFETPENADTFLKGRQLEPKT